MNGQGPKPFKWKHLEERTMSDEEIRRYFPKSPNIGVVFGKVSGFAECIDFDEPGYFEEWCELLEEHGHEDLLRKLVVQATQTPGHYQAMYRCPSGVEGNKKLAMRPPTEAELLANPGQKVYGIIETRGEGGYALVSPSAGYRLVQGDLGALPALSSEERGVLWDFARHFDAMPPQEAVQRPPRQPGTEPQGLLPGDDFDRRGEWHDVLSPQGWVPIRTRGRLTAWTRPGGDKGATSAHTGLGHGELDFMVVFSTNAYPLEPMPAKYGKFRAYAALNFPHLPEGERQSAAAKALYAKGYGERAKPKTSEQRVNDHSPAALPASASPDQEGATEERHSPDGEAPARVFQRMLWSELKAMPPKPMLVENLIGEGDSGMIAGVRKGGKTAVVLNLILNMISGRDFADGRFPIRRPLRVGYFTSEGKRSLGTRIEAANRLIGVPDEVIEENLWYFPKLPQIFDRQAESYVMRLVDELLRDDARLDVIFLDTFAKSTLGAEENSNSEMSLALATLGEARDALGCASELVHHANKAGDLRGASAVEGDLDILTWVKWDEKGSGDRSFEFGFAKDLAPWPAIPFELKTVDRDVPGSIRVQWSARAPYGDKAIDRILLFMMQNADFAWTAKQIAAGTDLKENTVQQTLGIQREGKPGGRVEIIHPTTPKGVLTYRLSGRTR